MRQSPSFEKRMFRLFRNIFLYFRNIFRNHHNEISRGNQGTGKILFSAGTICYNRTVVRNSGRQKNKIVEIPKKALDRSEHLFILKLRKEIKKFPQESKWNSHLECEIDSVTKRNHKICKLNRIIPKSQKKVQKNSRQCRSDSAGILRKGENPMKFFSIVSPKRNFRRGSAPERGEQP